MKHYKLIQQMNHVVFSCRSNHLESWKRNVYENLNHILHIWDPEIKKNEKWYFFSKIVLTYCEKKLF